MDNTVKLLQHLEEAYPQENPNPTSTLETIMYRAGQRSVIEYIANLIEE